MKIALLGYGKMGQEIERICIQRQYEIVAKVDKQSDWDTYSKEISLANVAIEFSTPATVLANIKKCFELKLPIVVGTTGWNDQKQTIQQECIETNNTLLYGSNFSVGVNLFFHLNDVFSKMINNYPDYKTSMTEIHHTQKLDSPSGTAITLADIIIENIDQLNSWSEEKTIDETVLNIESERIDPTPGTHSIKFSSEIDDIELTHTAKSRAGFAKGAVYAAEWLNGKTGWFEFKDILFNKS